MTEKTASQSLTEALAGALGASTDDGGGQGPEDRGHETDAYENATEHQAPEAEGDDGLRAEDSGELHQGVDEGEGGDSGFESDGSSERSEEGGDQPPRSQQRIRQLAAEKKEYERQLEEQKRQLQYLFTPQGKQFLDGYFAANGAPSGNMSDEDFSFANMTDKQVFEGIASESVRRARQQWQQDMQAELAVREGLSDLGRKFKDFDPARDGQAVRSMIAQGITNPTAAYFAAFPDRVEERIAHGDRAAHSRRSTPPSGARPSKPREQVPEDVAARRQILQQAEAGEVPSFGNLLAAAMAESQEEKSRHRARNRARTAT